MYLGTPPRNSWFFYRVGKCRFLNWKLTPVPDWKKLIYGWPLPNSQYFQAGLTSWSIGGDMTRSTACVVQHLNETLKENQRSYHSNCLFLNDPPVKGLRFFFSEDGVLKGRFICSEKHQGYDSIVHGGIIASIVDASMTQCCMGHGIVAYTADLSIRYRNPLKINTSAALETRIVHDAIGALFSLSCVITQEDTVHVEANGRFFKPSARIASQR
jgi:acyl-coenzyme A thioesterase PaaI-like protein